MIIIYYIVYCVTCPYIAFAFLQAPSLLLHIHSATLAANYYSQYNHLNHTAKLALALAPEQNALACYLQ